MPDRVMDEGLRHALAGGPADGFSAAAAETRSTTTISRGSCFGMSNQTILVVDDEPANLQKL